MGKERMSMSRSLFQRKNDNAESRAALPQPILGFEAFRSIDRMLGALTGQVTGGLSPAALTLAYMDWAMHLAAAPGKRTELAWKGVEKASRLAAHPDRKSVGEGRRAG